MNLISPGDLFGVSALMAEGTHQFQCDAFSDCVVARIDPQQFMDIMLGVTLADFRPLMGMLVSPSRELTTRYSMMLRLPVRDRLLTIGSSRRSQSWVPSWGRLMSEVPF
jgi:CRP-like cAMP-binding protein